MRSAACQGRAPGARIPMNAYVLIAGLSGLAVLCAMAFKGFGARR